MWFRLSLCLINVKEAGNPVAFIFWICCGLKNGGEEKITIYVTEEELPWKDGNWDIATENNNTGLHAC